LLQLYISAAQGHNIVKNVTKYQWRDK